MVQERIRSGKELIEAKRIAEENEKKRSVLIRFFPHTPVTFSFLVSPFDCKMDLFSIFFLLHSYLALRQSEKEEEKRARERIRWKLEQDKVLPYDIFNVNFDF